MKTYLLKLAVLSMATLSFSCTDTDDSADDMEEQIEDAILFSDCLTCLGYVFEQTNGSGTTTVTVPAAEVCKGSDDQAYVAGELNTEYENYEAYIRERQAKRPCTASN